MGRNEVGVGDEGFLTSMIPHHSRAILVCQEATITDPEIEQLCSEIVEAQERALIIDMLETTGGNQTQAAKMLGTTKRIIQYKISKLGIDPKAFKKTGKRQSPTTKA